jgi:hypothetical protein
MTMDNITRLTAREVAILKRNLHACYSRVPAKTDFLPSFIFDSIKFAYGVPWSRLQTQRFARGRANQSMWAEWRAYDRFQMLVAQLKRYDWLRPVRLAQLEACCEMAAKEKVRLEAKRPFPKCFRPRAPSRSSWPSCCHRE